MFKLTRNQKTIAKIAVVRVIVPIAVTVAAIALVNKLEKSSPVE